MQPKPAATIADLRNIIPKESGEPFVQWGSLWVRKQVAEKLRNVQQKLQEIGYDLLVVEGYRSPESQESSFLRQLLLEYDPSLSFEMLLEKTHAFIALPSVAGHPTGGAVDVTLLWEGKEIDMGCKIVDFSNPALLPTFSSAISPAQQESRILLHNLMLAEGFAPYYGEWWHFSFGDREWAHFYNLPESLYTPKVPDNTLPDARPVQERLIPSLQS